MSYIEMDDAGTVVRREHGKRERLTTSCLHPDCAQVIFGSSFSPSCRKVWTTWCGYGGYTNTNSEACKDLGLGSIVKMVVTLQQRSQFVRKDAVRLFALRDTHWLDGESLR